MRGKGVQELALRVCTCRHSVIWRVWQQHTWLYVTARCECYSWRWQCRQIRHDILRDRHHMAGEQKQQLCRLIITPRSQHANEPSPRLHCQ